MIELRGITKTFILGDSRVNAVDGVDLDIGRGEYISIMGPSGSGKSTLLNLVALLDRPTAGTYVFDSRDVVGLDDDELAAIRRQAIGFIFQFFHLIPRLTAAQNVELPLTLAGVDPAQRQTRVHAVLERMDLVDRATHRPAELSGRQRQRVAIARATITQPALLLADEPTGNLDTASGRQVIGVLEDLHSSQDVTLLVVTYDADLGRRAGRRICIVDGPIEQDLRG